MATPIEYGLIAALVAVVIITGVTAADDILNPKPSPPPPAVPKPHCPSGMTYIPSVKACFAGAALPTFR